MQNQYLLAGQRMKKASRNDKSVVVGILAESFKKDPHISWLLQQCHHPNKIKLLMQYVFDKTIRIGDIYLTYDNKGVALWKSNKKEKFTFEYAWRNILFFFKIGPSSIIRILRNEIFTYQQYPKGQYHHLYLIGVLPECQGQGYASALLNPVLNEMAEKSVPVYLETANINNVKIYEKKGFQVYNTWFWQGLALYYMKKE